MEPMNQKKRIPIGIDDFERLVEDNYYFADKSLLIKELFDSGAAVTLIPRPRRFGKTLNMSMLRWFFEKSEKSKRYLFNGLKIEQYSDCMEHQGKYPVIWLTFKDVKTSAWEESYRLLRIQIMREFERHNYVRTLLFDAEKERFERIRQGKCDLADLMGSLLDLSIYLERAHKTKVIILIDEYDTPIHAGYSNGYYDEVINFMRSFMGSALKGNNALQWGVLTGILRVGKESVFSDMNNLRVCNVTTKAYADKFGFLEDEVIAMLHAFNLDAHIDIVRDWYDGYQSGGYKIYNPWSIVNLVDNNGRFQPYWVNTSSNALIKDLLKRCTPEMKEELEILITGGRVTKAVQENIIMADIEQNDEVLWNFLLFCGYLTFENYRLVKDTNYAELLIPNVEVGTTYKTTFSTWFSEGFGLRNYNKMLASLVAGNPSQFKKYFEQFCGESLSYFDTKGTEPERFYHALVLGMLASLMETHYVRSNRESGDGRYDVMVIPHDLSKPGAVIEFKAVDLDKKETLETAAKSAFKQIEKNKYEAELRALGLTRILKLGISFLGKESLCLTETV
ncbi:MAG: hypothetical protein UV38_C0004G0008 [candidate division TM6 bacterium GW2011_GWE2_42_60]|nr:MAG: hypothetical protein UV38_C0004G0008 [candidate division TM6 bacterium GW2011_GWE2_42_60]HBY05886.1 AAA family ATPase [Candidatus Dependentiae bacterium]